MRCLAEIKGGVAINIVVSANARKTEIIGLHNNRLKLKIHAPPVDGKANSEIQEFFAEYFALAKSNVRISHGEKNKLKTVEIQKLSYSEASKRLSSYSSS